VDGDCTLPCSRRWTSLVAVVGGACGWPSVGWREEMERKGKIGEKLLGKERKWLKSFITLDLNYYFFLNEGNDGATSLGTLDGRLFAG
jgi:hypothetical protein